MTKQVVLLSGGTSGIGKAITFQLLKEGFFVSTFAPEPPSVKAFSKELSQIFAPESFLVMPGDVTKEASLKKVISATVKKFKKIDILINNAGYGIFFEADKINIKAYQEMLEVNVVGVAQMTKLVLPYLKKQNKGLIINIDSISGRWSFPRSEFYSATKFAIMGYTDGLRQELAPYNIRVTTVCPGMVKTHFLSKEEYDIRIKHLWKGKEPARLEAGDVARSVSFICKEPDNVEIRDILIMPFE